MLVKNSQVFSCLNDVRLALVHGFFRIHMSHTYTLQHKPIPHVYYAPNSHPNNPIHDQNPITNGKMLNTGFAAHDWN